MAVKQRFCSSFLHCTRTYITRTGRSRLPKIPKKSSSNVSHVPSASTKQAYYYYNYTCQVVHFTFQIVEIRRQGEFLYGVSPCLAALQANRRRIYKIYVKPGVSEKKGAMKR